MFHADDLIRPIRTGAGLERVRERAGVRARPRTTDVDAFLDGLGLGGRVRRR